MQGLLVGIGFVLAWSSGFIGAEWMAGEAAPPTAVLACRYLATVGLVTVPLLPRVLRLAPVAIGQQLVLGVLAHAVYLGGVFAAASRGTGPGVVALVCALQPALVVLAGRWWWGDAVSRRQLAGVVLGLGGVALTVGSSAADPLGLLLAGGSLLGLTAAALLERRWRPEADVATSLAVQVLGAAVVLTAVAVLGGGLALEPTAPVLAGMVWLVVLSGLGGYLGFIAGLRVLGAARTSTLLYLTPPVTSLWAWAMLGLRPGGGELAGLVVGAAAVALFLWPDRSGRRPTRGRCGCPGASGPAGWRHDRAQRRRLGRARPRSAAAGRRRDQPRRAERGRRRAVVAAGPAAARGRDGRRGDRGGRDPRPAGDAGGARARDGVRRPRRERRAGGRADGRRR